MHLVQARYHERSVVAVIESASLHLLEPYASVYELALNAIRQERTLTELVQQAASGKTLDYDAVYQRICKGMRKGIRNGACCLRSIIPRILLGLWSAELG